MTEEERRRLAVRHVVHEYANFISSGKMVQTGLDIDGVLFQAPINTHVSHAFYLNRRKLADFFQNKRGCNDDILAEHYVSGFKGNLPEFDKLRERINKQLAHVTYARDTKVAKAITKEESRKLYAELKDTWKEFRKALIGGPYAD